MDRTEKSHNQEKGANFNKNQRWQINSALTRVLDWNEKYDELRRKETLTNKEVQWIVDRFKYQHPEKKKVRLRLNSLKMITDEQAKCLSQIKCLDLSWLEEISDEQARFLGHSEYLDLSWLKKIKDWQARSLSWCKCLDLSWLKKITDEQAKSLSQIPILYLNWLEEVTEFQAMKLWEVKVFHIYSLYFI